MKELEWECVSYDKNGNPQLERPFTELENLCHTCRIPSQIPLNYNNECMKCSAKRRKSEQLRNINKEEDKA